MDRREFVLGAASAAIAPLGRSNSVTEVAVHLAAPGEKWPFVPVDFIGLSYEMGQLYNPRFFSTENKPLIQAFRALNTNGVLRLGGHLSNITPWQGVGQDDPKQIAGVRHGIQDYWEWPLVDPVVQQNKHGILTRHAIENLRGFLDAVGWRLIYGLNFACGSAARAADEAAAVSDIMGERLIAFVIGNEADGFGEDPYFRAAGYGFDQYIAEYETWVKAIREPMFRRAQFAGPDTDGKVDTWVLGYARRTKGDAFLLTSHYYGMGPASDPAMTAERLLRKTNPELEAQIAAVAAARQAAGGTPYRMDEGNSCFGGGRPRCERCLRLCPLGSGLHSQGSLCRICGRQSAWRWRRSLHADRELSDRTGLAPPGLLRNAICPDVLRLAASHPCGSIQAPISRHIRQANPEKTMLAFVNKGESPVRLALPDRFARAQHIQRWELRGPSLSAKTGVQFVAAPPDQQRSRCRRRVLRRDSAGRMSAAAYFFSGFLAK